MAIDPSEWEPLNAPIAPAPIKILGAPPVLSGESEPAPRIPPLRFSGTNDLPNIVADPEDAVDRQILKQQRHPIQAGIGAIGKGFGFLGRLLKAGAADVGGEITGENKRAERYERLSRMDPDKYPPIPSEKGDIDSLLAGEPIPSDAAVKQLPTALRIPTQAAQGLIETAPKLAAVAGAQAAGVPAPIAAGAIFGTTEEGFDPKQAAIAAALPFVGKYGGQMVEALAAKLGVSNDTALFLFNKLGGTAGAAGYLKTIDESEIANLPPEQRDEARINSWANIAGQAVLGAMGEREGAKITPEKIQVQWREIERPTKGGPNAVESETTQPVRGVRVQPGENVGEVPTKGGSEKAGGGGSEGQPRQKPSPVEASKTPEELADDFGMRYEATGEGRWMFTAYDKTGKPTTTFAVKVGSTPEQIAEKYEQVRKSYEDAPDAPRPPGPTPKLPDIEEIAKMSGSDFEKALQASIRRPTRAGYELGQKITPEQRARIGELDVATSDELKGLVGKAEQTQNVEEKFALLNEGQKLNSKKQYFNEAARLYDANQEVKATGDKSAAAKKFGVDEKFIKSPQPEPALVVGPGAARPQDVGAKPELAQLTDTLRTMASSPSGKPEYQRAYTLGERVSQWKDPVLKSIDGLKAAAQVAKISLQSPAKWNDYKSALGKRQLALSESTLTAREFMDKAVRGVPKALDREAISNLIDNGLDQRALLRAIAETDPKYEKGYQRALEILAKDPELTNVARNAQNYFEARLDDAIRSGILEEGVENYIHRVYEKNSEWKDKAISELRSGVFTGKPALAKQRVFDYDYEAEKAGYKPVKDFATRIAMYDMALNKAIADRQLVREMMQWKMKDGRPAIDVGGRGERVGGLGEDAAFLIKPQYKPNLEEKPGMTPEQIQQVKENNRGDYIPFDHPALRKWRWAEQTDMGSPIMVQGSVYVHPDALPEIKSVFGKSLVRESAIGRAALGVSSTIKQTMLDLSGFHPVQITVHGWEHRADVPLGRWSANITGRTFKPIDLNDPVQRSLVSHGLNVVDYNGHQVFSEGVSGAGSSLLRHIPMIGPKLQAYNHWLFQDYIPRLKMEMATHALERNRAAYEKDLASGKMTEDQLLHMTANQANAAFGELNYEMMSRNKTTQDMLRLGLLAPDFLEARGRFAAQAAKTAVGGYGREQLVALGLGAATLYLTARILNKMINGQYHFEPEHAFDVMNNGRAYSLRTVQGDLIHAVFNPRSFIYTRLNPVTTRTLFEGITGRDQFGRPRSASDQLKDFASTIVPISARGLLNPREQKLWESFLNAFGITERRATASDSIYKLAQEFKDKNKISQPGEFIYDPQKDPYRSIKLALMYETPEKAAQEIRLAVDSGVVDWDHISNYFDQFGTRPFTGSRKNEDVFWKSLSEDQKNTYREALKERQKMRDNAREAFKLIRQQSQQPKKP